MTEEDFVGAVNCARKSFLLFLCFGGSNRSITPIPPSLRHGLRAVKRICSRTHNFYSFGSEVSLAALSEVMRS